MNDCDLGFIEMRKGDWADSINFQLPHAVFLALLLGQVIVSRRGVANDFLVGLGALLNLLCGRRVRIDLVVGVLETPHEVGVYILYSVLPVVFHGLCPKLWHGKIVTDSNKRGHQIRRNFGQ